MSDAAKGLAGVIAADTTLSRVDGEKGELIYRGYDIMDLG
jgi:citrate synthase